MKEMNVITDKSKTTNLKLKSLCFKKYNLENSENNSVTYFGKSFGYCHVI